MKLSNIAPGQLAAKQLLFLFALCCGCSYLDHDPNLFGGSGSQQGVIAFASERDGDFDIYLVDADGNNLTQMTDAPGTDTAPTWSPPRLRLQSRGL